MSWGIVIKSVKTPGTDWVGDAADNLVGAEYSAIRAGRQEQLQKYSVDLNTDATKPRRRWRLDTNDSNIGYAEWSMPNFGALANLNVNTDMKKIVALYDVLRAWMEAQDLPDEAHAKDAALNTNIKQYRKWSTEYQKNNNVPLAEIVEIRNLDF